MSDGHYNGEHWRRDVWDNFVQRGEDGNFPIIIILNEELTYSCTLQPAPDSPLLDIHSPIRNEIIVMLMVWAHDIAVGEADASL